MILVLSLFPGIGLLDYAFELEGFCVVRGPDLLWGGDIRRFNPPNGRFDGVIGGPPCQIFSRMRHLNPRAGKKHGDLIPEFLRCVAQAKPNWFLMENVPEAPVPQIAGYLVTARMVTDVEVGGITSRSRRFSFGTRGLDCQRFQVETRALWPYPEPAVLAGGGGRAVPVRLGGTGKRKKTIDGRRHGPHTGPRAPVAVMLHAQGLPENFFEDCPLTIEGQRHGLGNGVPIPMGRAVARAVKKAIGYD